MITHARQKLVLLGAAAALTTATVVTPALSAPVRVEGWRAEQHRSYDRDYRGPGFVGGAIVGAATAPLWAPAYAFGGPGYYEPQGPVVAPVVRTPFAPHYAYNRYSGQVYQKCVIDDGYGRTQPCSGGSAQ